MLAKRCFDIVAAAAGLLVLAPLLLLIAAWIRWDSAGPVLFRQCRTGRNGVPFLICKFRTMAHAAPAAQTAQAAQAGGLLSMADDARATGAGRWLRRHKLDELPQLFNVLRGDMSLVGPRPEVPCYVAQYPAAVRAIVLSVRPGITDWAALRFRHEGELLRRAANPEHTYLTRVLPVKLKYYVRYVQRRTLAVDLHILLVTVATLLLRPAGKRPLVRVLGRSTLTPRDGQSALIDWLRGLAALQVAAAHLRAQVFPGLGSVSEPPLWYQGLAFCTGFAHQAVLVFFVLSGWLVGGVFLDRSDGVGRAQALRDYAIDRLTRLWTVLLPAFLLMLALTWAGALPPAGAWSWTTLLGNLVGLQTLTVPPFGDNFPLWSLANETWYYVLFPLLVLSLRPGGLRVRLACAALAVGVAAWLGAGITGYFLVWLLGVAASRVRLALAPRQRALCWGVFGLLAAWLRLQGQDGDFGLATLAPDLLYAAVLVVCLCGTGRRRLPAGAVAGQGQPQGDAAYGWRQQFTVLGKLLAGFSFTLYVVHIPLQRMLWSYRDGAQLSPHAPASLAVYAAVLAVVLALAYLFHLPFEAQTVRLRRLIRRRLLAGDAGAAIAAAPVRQSADAG